MFTSLLQGVGVEFSSFFTLMTTVVKFRYAEADLFTKHPEFLGEAGQEKSGQELTTHLLNREKTDPHSQPLARSCHEGICFATPKFILREKSFFIGLVV
jgi:hypothetical protein